MAKVFFSSQAFNITELWHSIGYFSLVAHELSSFISVVNNAWKNEVVVAIDLRSSLQVGYFFLIFDIKKKLFVMRSVEGLLLLKPLLRPLYSIRLLVKQLKILFPLDLSCRLHSSVPSREIFLSTQKECLFALSKRDLYSYTR